MGKAEDKTQETEQPKGVEQELATEQATDIDGDGKIDLDPDKVEATLGDLVKLDHALRDHGLTVADLLKHVAASSRGIFV